MKSLICAVIINIIIIQGLAYSAPSHMRETDEKVKLDIKTVKPEKGMAALVITRTTVNGFGSSFDTYLDKKMIGVTRGRGYFITKNIQPGKHYVISDAENFDTVLLNFEPDRVYYLHQTPRPGWLKVRVSMYIQDPEITMNDMSDSCELIEYDSTNPGDDLTDDDFNKAVKDYNEDLANGEYKDHAAYRGFEAK